MATRIEANVSTGISSTKTGGRDECRSIVYTLYEMIGTIPKINTYTGTF